MGKPTKSAKERPAWAKRLEAARLLTNMDQKTFAAALGVQAETYRRWERGETQPGLENLVKIRAVAGISLDMLIAGETFTARDRLKIVTNS